MAAIRRLRRHHPPPEATSSRALRSPAEPPDAHAAAIRMLARRELSEAQLRTRLAESFDPAQIDAAITRLREAGAVDDRRVASAYARTAIGIKRRGHLRVERELEAMGIDRALARQAVEAARQETDEEALLAREVERRAKGRPLDQRARMRLYSQLLRRGFPADLVIAALRRHRLSPDED